MVKCCLFRLIFSGLDFRFFQPQVVAFWVLYLSSYFCFLVVLYDVHFFNILCSELLID